MCVCVCLRRNTVSQKARPNKCRGCYTFTIVCHQQPLDKKSRCRNSKLLRLLIEILITVLIRIYTTSKLSWRSYILSLSSCTDHMSLFEFYILKYKGYIFCRVTFTRLYTSIFTYLSIKTRTLDFFSLYIHECVNRYKVRNSPAMHMCFYR